MRWKTISTILLVLSLAILVLGAITTYQGYMARKVGDVAQVKQLAVRNVCLAFAEILTSFGWGITRVIVGNEEKRAAKGLLSLWLKSILLPAAMFGLFTLIALALGCKELAISAIVAGVVGATVVGAMCVIDFICPMQI